MITGINTEKGVFIQNFNFIGNKIKEKKILPKEIIEIQKLINESKTIQIEAARSFPYQYRDIQKKHNKIIDRLHEILLISDSTKTMCFAYENSLSLLKSQKVLIQLSNHLADFAPLVDYYIKPFYFRCIACILQRGELELEYLNPHDSFKKILQTKVKIGVSYCKMLYKVLKLAFSRMVLKGIDRITQEYVDTTLAIGCVRIPEFRECIKDLIKRKSYYDIYE